jgi:hypothetical protein
MDVGMAWERGCGHGVEDVGLAGAEEDGGGDTVLLIGVAGRLGKYKGPVCPQAPNKAHKDRGNTVLTRIRALLNIGKL